MPVRFLGTTISVLILINTVILSAAGIFGYVQTQSAKSNRIVELQPRVLGQTTTESAVVPTNLFTSLKSSPNALQPKTSGGQQSKYVSDTEIPNVQAASYLILDNKTGTVLAQKRAGVSFPMASLTKLMTAYVAFHELEPTTLLTVAKSDEVSISPTLGLKSGEIVRTDSLIRAMLVGSANDAGLVLGRSIAEKKGKPFIQIMNEYAESLQLTETHFSNPIGFDSEMNYTSAVDLVKLIHATTQTGILNEIQKLSAAEVVTNTNRVVRVKSTNKLLQYPDILSVKTGFTEQANGSMIVRLQSGQKEYLLIVLQSPQRETDILGLRSYILNQK